MSHDEWHNTQAPGTTLTRTALMSNATSTISAAALGVYATRERILVQQPPASISRSGNNPCQTDARRTRALCSWSSSPDDVHDDAKNLRPPTSRDAPPGASISHIRSDRTDTPSKGTAPASSLLTFPGAAVDKTECGRCCRSLQKTFQNCGQIPFARICCALSLVLNSLQILQKDELTAAVSVVMASYQKFRQEGGDGKDLQQTSTNDWFQTANALLEVDESGFVCFKVPSMKDFLRAFWVRGIDSSHKTIATACLTQTAIDKPGEPDDSRKDPSTLAYRCSAFSPYASQHCELHVRKAEEIGPV